MKKTIIASLLAEVILFAIILLAGDKMGVLTLLLAVTLPLPVNALACHIDSRQNNYGSEMSQALIYTGLTAAFLLVTGIYLIAFGDIDNILAHGLPLNSEYMEITTDNSPVFSGIVMVLVSFSLNYLSVKLSKKKPENTASYSDI